MPSTMHRARRISQSSPLDHERMLCMADKQPEGSNSGHGSGCCKRCSQDLCLRPSTTATIIGAVEATDSPASSNDTYSWLYSQCTMKSTMLRPPACRPCPNPLGLAAVCAAAFPVTLLQAWWRSTNPSRAILKAGPMCWVACPAGLLADVEMDSMSDLVERRQKELHFTPPRVPVVPLRQELAAHPMFRELPPQTLLRVGQQW